MSLGAMFGVRPAVNSVTTPSVVMRPIRPGSALPVNQSAPSGPVAIELRSLPGVMPAVKCVIVPVVVMRPTNSGLWLTNQRFPSGPAVMSTG
jgi:hypothetical protein